MQKCYQAPITFRVRTKLVDCLHARLHQYTANSTGDFSKIARPCRAEYQENNLRHISVILCFIVQKRKQYTSFLDEDIVISDSVDTDLHSLRLENLKLKTIGSAAFAPGAFPRLVDLSLANNSIEDFTPLGALRMLKRLDISCNKIDGRLFAGYREVHHGKPE